MTRPPTLRPFASTDLTSERRDYSGPRLLEAESPPEPLELFSSWIERARSDGLLDATAMVVSTATPDGRPSARVVLLKGQDDRGFVFFTRYSTQKGAELAANPRASLLFHWRELDRQVRIDASIERLPLHESEEYFASRPRLSQLAAHAASRLEQVAAGALEARFAAAAERWQDRPIEMPEDWGGYRARPGRIEFWQGRPNRLHDRLVYELDATGRWSRHRLAP